LLKSLIRTPAKNVELIKDMNPHPTLELVTFKIRESKDEIENRIKKLLYKPLPARLKKTDNERFRLRTHGYLVTDGFEPG